MTRAGRSTRIVDARLHLLSRQVLDVDGEPVAVVDDLELVAPDASQSPAPGSPARIGAVLCGPSLVTRLFGGRPPASRRARIEWDDVERLGTTLELRVRADSLDVGWAERWVRDRMIGRIPGGQHDPEASS